MDIKPRDINRVVRIFFIAFGILCKAYKISNKNESPEAKRKRCVYVSVSLE
jgi:hypothetical protein